MTNFSKDNILHLAKLSGLTLAPSEVDSLAVDLKNIINYIDQLSELDTEGVEPTYQVGSLSNIWREDEVEASVITREDLLALAPHQKDNAIEVPKVL